MHFSYKSCNKHNYKMAESLRYEYVSLPYDKQIPIHTQHSWELSCVITGEGERLIGNISEHFTAGDTVLIPPEIPHLWQFKSDNTNECGYIENITIIFKTSFLKNIQKCFPELSNMMVHLLMLKDAIVFSGDTKRKIFNLMLRMRTETCERRIFSFVEILMIIAEDKIGRIIVSKTNLNKSEAKYLRIKAYINCNYHREITLDEISKYVGMNKTAFCFFFKQHTGYSFIEYLNFTRLSIASEMLLNTDFSIKEVCAKAGIPDIAYFCRIFKKKFGLTPTQFRVQSNNL